MDGMEITQFTYFQQAGGIDLAPISVELTYGLERIAMYLQGVRSVYDLEWGHGVTYGELYRLNEAQWSRVQLRGRRHRRPVRRVRPARARVRPLPGGGPGAARLRPGAQVQPRVQPARRARRHQRHRAGRVHLASTHARLPGGAGLARAERPRAHRTRGRCVPDLLVEVGCEELPSSACREIIAQAPELFATSLEALGLEAPRTVELAVAPRRFALVASGLPEGVAATSRSVRGPSAEAAFDGEGAPTRAAEGFARGQGVAVESLVVRRGERAPLRVRRARREEARVRSRSSCPSWSPG